MTEKGNFADLKKACEETGKSLQGFIIGLKNNNAHVVPEGILHDGPFQDCPINCCVYARRVSGSPF